MDIAGTIASILTSTSVVSLIQFFVNRRDKQYDRLATIEYDVKSVKEAQNEILLRITRGDLKDLIRNDPNNTDAILQIAQRYFIELGNGDAYTHAMFEKWALEHEVPIGWLPKISKKGARNGS